MCEPSPKAVLCTVFDDNCLYRYVNFRHYTPVPRPHRMPVSGKYTKPCQGDWPVSHTQVRELLSQWQRTARLHAPTSCSS